MGKPVPMLGTSPYLFTTAEDFKSLSTMVFSKASDVWTGRTAVNRPSDQRTVSLLSVCPLSKPRPSSNLRFPALDQVDREIEHLDSDADDAKTMIEAAHTGEYEVIDSVEVDDEDHENLRRMRDTPFPTRAPEVIGNDDDKLHFRAIARQGLAPLVQYILTDELSWKKSTLRSVREPTLLRNPATCILAATSTVLLQSILGGSLNVDKHKDKFMKAAVNMLWSRRNSQPAVHQQALVDAKGPSAPPVTPEEDDDEEIEDENDSEYTADSFDSIPKGRPKMTKEEMMAHKKANMSKAEIMIRQLAGEEDKIAGFRSSITGIYVHATQIDVASRRY
ncbi:hypothetical protein MMC18_007567 [Xylographa bjoerkii]|nr:hypothetical protein [Xylographa bjoerkii]